MRQLQNPFTTLYVTERMEDDKFPDLFSKILVSQALPLFQAGNVVVSGTQGTGKSMLLALLRTDIRLAFASNQENPYPVQGQLCQFVSAEINLATNQALRFAHRWSGTANEELLIELQNSFTDYINSWLLRDLLISLNTLRRSPTGIWHKYDLGPGEADLDAGVQAIGQNNIGNSLLTNPRDCDDACVQLTRRIETYLRFLNGKLRKLPIEISDQQTQAIGEPITAAVDVLRAHGCLNSATRVLITIDQFEQLLDFEVKLKGRHFNLLRSVIDEAIHLRMPTICYRVGTRPHAWRDRRSERLRDYIELDLDEMLRRKENARKPIFPLLAEDVFRRRLKCFGYPSIAVNKDPLKKIFGSSPSPSQRIGKMISGGSSSRLLRMPKSFPVQVRHTIEEIAQDDLLSAKLGVAWVHQRLADRDVSVPDMIETLTALPWEQPDKKWWKKERVGLSILQLAAACGQRVPMYGKTDILNLSGSNILVFASICQHIWACWLRPTSSEHSVSVDHIPVEWALQVEGVRNASREWHNKISEEAWLGDSLTQFIDVMGNHLHSSLIADRAMSYPGGNGISLANKDLKLFSEVEQILLDGTDRGFLLRRRHTPKTRSRGPSTKWYLHPVLAPYYELTVGHTKEPLYFRSEQVYKWMVQAGIAVAKRSSDNKPVIHQKQKQLPGFEGLP